MYRYHGHMFVVTLEMTRLFFLRRNILSVQVLNCKNAIKLRFSKPHVPRSGLWESIGQRTHPEAVVAPDLRKIRCDNMRSSDTAFEVLSYWHMENEQAGQPPKSCRWLVYPEKLPMFQCRRFFLVDESQPLLCHKDTQIVAKKYYSEGTVRGSCRSSCYTRHLPFWHVPNL